MFDELIREIKKMEQGIYIKVPLDVDEEGYLDRQCPSEECRFQFKIYGEDWGKIVRDEEVFCSFCGYQAAADQWNTVEQIEYAEKVTFKEAQDRITRALEVSARDFNRRQNKGGLISMQMKVKGRFSPVYLPRSVTETMRIKIKCLKCECRFAVIGAAYFCPACGYNSAVQIFHQSIGSIRQAVESIPSIKNFLSTEVDKDTAANTTRLLIENCLINLVGTFQRVAESLFKKLPNQPALAPRRNAFQNLFEAENLWENAGGHSFRSILTSAKFEVMQKLFQQRHLIAHKDGIVDQNYLDRSGDTNYKVGQKLIIREPSIIQLASILEELGNAMIDDVEKAQKTR